MAFNNKPSFFRLSPAQYTLVSFIIISLTGAILLSLPLSKTAINSHSFLDALFMSVSAVCVAGLSIVDIAKDYTDFGRWVFIILMQIGGLSYMTLTTILLYLIGQKITYSDSKIFNLSNNSETNIDFAKFVKRIGLFTLSFELLGVIFLLPQFLRAKVENSLLVSIFHSISAFCNVGLSTFTNSLIDFADNYSVLFIIAFLTIFGGLGYTALHELWEFTLAWFKYQKDKKRSNSSKILPFNFKLSLHTKICIWMTLLVLIVSITIQFFFFVSQVECCEIIASKSLDAFVHSTFNMITARSSGFTSVDLGLVSDTNLSFISLLMFIGACAGGTAGGIKLTTFLIILAFLYMIAKNQGELRLFKRAIPVDIQQKSIVVFIGSIIIMYIAISLMSFVEQNSNLPFADICFEIISAFNTVGFSTGITSSLSPISLIILIIMMLIGRPGVLLVMMVFISEDKCKAIQYPEEALLI